MTTTEQKLKWVQTLFLEIEPNTVFSFNGLMSKALHGSPFQTKGWRIRRQDAQKENKYPEGKTFKTRKAAKQWVEWYYNKNAGEEKIVSDPAVQELIAESK